MNIGATEKFLLQNIGIKIVCVILLTVSSFIFLASDCGVTGNCGTSILAWVLFLLTFFVYFIGQTFIEAAYILSSRNNEDIHRYLRESIIGGEINRSDEFPPPPVYKTRVQPTAGEGGQRSFPGAVYKTDADDIEADTQIPRKPPVPPRDDDMPLWARNIQDETEMWRSHIPTHSTVPPVPTYPVEQTPIPTQQPPSPPHMIIN